MARCSEFTVRRGGVTVCGATKAETVVKSSGLGVELAKERKEGGKVWVCLVRNNVHLGVQ